MELIIAIAIIVIGVAVWYNRKKPVAPVVEAETFSDNGIKFTAPEPVAPAPVVEPTPAPVVEAPVEKPAKAKKPAAPKAPAKAKKPAAK